MMDRDCSGVVLGSDILVKGMYRKCPVGEAQRSSDDTGEYFSLAHASVTTGSSWLSHYLVTRKLKSIMSQWDCDLV